MSTQPAVEGQDPARRLRASDVLGKTRDYGIVAALVALFIVLSISSDVFLSERNLLNILEQWAPVAVMAIGATIVLITGGFDLSVGAMFTLAGVAAVALSDSTLVGVLVGVGAGLGMGLINGTLGTIGRVNVFVATLGTSIVFAGLAAATTGGTTQISSNQGYGFFSNDYLGINLSIWVLLIVVIVSIWVLARTTIGRYFFAVGGNEEAARLAGVRVSLVRLTAFAAAGATAGMAAVMISSRSLSASASNSTSIAFNVWTAMLLGGNSMLGGEGAVWRTIVGVFLLALIANGFDLLGIDPLYQQVATGGILLAAVSLDAWARRRR